MSLWFRTRDAGIPAPTSTAVERVLAAASAVWFYLYTLGPLTAVLCGPQWHRIHHSRLPEHRDRNFAQIFPVLDWLFGTYYAPARDEFPPTGTDGLASDAPVWRAELRPAVLWRDGVRGWIGRQLPD